jgi:hypothetical protein
MMELNYDINEFLQHIDCFGIEWKRYMIRLLGKLKDARAVNYLIHEMQHSSSRIVRNAVLWALIDIADIRAFESLASLIQHGVVNHRRYSARLIVRALLALQTPEAISVALSIPVNSSTFVEYFHLYHLFRWTLGDNYQPVLPSLKHENPIVRGNAVICLSFFNMVHLYFSMRMST